MDIKSKRDQWGVGVLAYALLTGELPFQATTQEELNDKIKAGVPSFNGFEKLSKSARAFIEGMIKVDVTTRWTAEEAYNSNWIREMRDKKKVETSDEVDLKSTLKGLIALDN